MRALIFCFSLIVLAGTASAAQITLDEDYMQTMEDRQKSLSNNIGVQNIAGANEDVKELEDMFGEVQEYYESKGNAKNAVDWSKDARSAPSSSSARMVGIELMAYFSEMSRLASV